MTEYWQRSIVKGIAGDEEIKETVLHKRGEDPITMACRRNLELAGCGRITVETAEAFMEDRKGPEARRTKDEIPSGGHQGEEWDW